MALRHVQGDAVEAIVTQTGRRCEARVFSNCLVTCHFFCSDSVGPTRLKVEVAGDFINAFVAVRFDYWTLFKGLFAQIFVKLVDYNSVRIYFKEFIEEIALVECFRRDWNTSNVLA